MQQSHTHDWCVTTPAARTGGVVGPYKGAEGDPFWQLLAHWDVTVQPQAPAAGGICLHTHCDMECPLPLHTAGAAAAVTFEELMKQPAAAPPAASAAAAVSSSSGAAAPPQQGFSGTAVQAGVLPAHVLDQEYDLVHQVGGDREMRKEVCVGGGGRGGGGGVGRCGRRWGQRGNEGSGGVGSSSSGRVVCFVMQPGQNERHGYLATPGIQPTSRMPRSPSPSNLPPPPRPLPQMPPTRAPGCTTAGCWATHWEPWRQQQQQQLMAAVALIIAAAAVAVAVVSDSRSWLQCGSRCCR
jgi:hypothetical protein